jgi:hypothetical protein
MAATSRADLIESIQQSNNDLRVIVSDMKETVALTREMIDGTRARMREADDLLERR